MCRCMTYGRPRQLVLCFGKLTSQWFLWIAFSARVIRPFEELRDSIWDWMQYVARFVVGCRTLSSIAVGVHLLATSVCNAADRAAGFDPATFLSKFSNSFLL